MEFLYEMSLATHHEKALHQANIPVAVMGAHLPLSLLVMIIGLHVSNLWDLDQPVAQNGVGITECES